MGIIEHTWMNCKFDARLFEPLQGAPIGIKLEDDEMEIQFPNGEITVRYAELWPLLNRYAPYIPRMQNVRICDEMDNDCWELLTQALTKCNDLRILYIDAAWGIRNGANTFLADLIRANPKMERLTVWNTNPSEEPRKELYDAISDHTSLQFVRHNGLFGEDDVAELIRVIRENRSLLWITAWPPRLSETTERELLDAVGDNWVHYQIVANDSPQLMARVAERNSPRWRELRNRLGDAVVTMLPLRLPTYELLWILDWLPPISRRYRWRGDPAYDPYHGKKVALIEGMTRSYRAIKG
jgi:hypothetical protein